MSRYLNFIFLTSLLFQNYAINAQSKPRTLRELSEIIQKGKSDSLRMEANHSFKVQLNEFLNTNASPNEDYPDSVTNLSVLTSPDKSFKLITWVVTSVDRNHFYYHGFLQQFDKKNKTNKIYQLTDVGDTLSNTGTAKLSDGLWYGCVYYKILQHKKSGKNIYTLLGWRGNNRQTTKKLIDVLSFNGDKIQFGYPVFKLNKKTQYRIIFEFTTEASMSLRYEEKQKLIVYDHLSIPTYTPFGEKSESNLLGPDGTYDALEFRKSRWNYLKDIDIGTNWKPKKSTTKEPAKPVSPLK